MQKFICSSIALVVFSVVFLSSNAAYCKLGGTLAQTKSKTSLFKKKYGAVAPMFETDKNGRIIWECWAAPPQMWSKKEALTFAKNLLPSSLKSETPKRGTKDVTLEPYIYSDGTIIILSEFKGRYIGVEVRAPGYDGPFC